MKCKTFLFIFSIFVIGYAFFGSSSIYAYDYTQNCGSSGSCDCIIGTACRVDGDCNIDNNCGSFCPQPHSNSSLVSSTCVASADYYCKCCPFTGCATEIGASWCNCYISSGLCYYECDPGYEWVGLQCVLSNQPPTAPTALQVNSQINPDIYTNRPGFSAVYNDPDSGDSADYFQIQVSDTLDFSSGNIWDSGKMSMISCNQGERCTEITYDGPSLSDQTTYFWRIKYWDEHDLEGAWSEEIAAFNTRYGCQLESGTIGTNCTWGNSFGTDTENCDNGTCNTIRGILEPGGEGENTSSISIASEVTVTIGAYDTLIVGEIDLSGDSGQIIIVDGGVIKPGGILWYSSTDCDENPLINKAQPAPGYTNCTNCDLGPWECDSSCVRKRPMAECSRNYLYDYISEDYICSGGSEVSGYCSYGSWNCDILNLCFKYRARATCGGKGLCNKAKPVELTNCSWYTKCQDGSCKVGSCADEHDCIDGTCQPEYDCSEIPEGGTCMDKAFCDPTYFCEEGRGCDKGSCCCVPIVIGEPSQ